MGLGGILDDRHAVALRDLDQRVHVGHQPVQVDGHDRLRPGRDRRLDAVGVHAEVVCADVDEHRPGPRLEDRADRRVEGEADGNDFVTGTDAERPQDGLEGDGPVGHEHGVPHAAVGGPRLLEFGGSAAHRDHARAKDVEDGLLFVGADVRPGDRDHAEVPSPMRVQRSPSIS